jgi:uncharacterized protein YjbI with pentapeptide repeats
MSDALYHQGLTIEIDLSVPKATIEGCEIHTEDLARLFNLPNSTSEKFEEVKLYCKQFIDKSEAFLKREKARIKHEKILMNGVNAWNDWRDAAPTIRPLLYGSNLTKKALGRKLDEVNFSNAVLIKADLQGQSLRKANFHEANLGGAYLECADLTEANFCRTDLYETKMQNAILTKANLQGTQLAKTDLTGATLIGCKVYGMSAWDLTLDGAKQQDLKIRYRLTGDYHSDEGISETELLTDNLQLSQFMYMLLNNKNLASVINATTSKVVLILGRFTPRVRMDILRGTREALRKKTYVPILFDFPPPNNRDLTETIQLVGNLSKFVIADLTDAKSIPQELSHIVPNLPSVPIQPILLESQEREYAMFEHWQHYPWVLPVFLYRDREHLMANLDENVITPAMTPLRWLQLKDSLSKAQKEIQDLKQQIAELPKAPHE